MGNSIGLMFGLPGQGMHLHLDALSLLFGCILLPQVVAAAVAGMRASVAFWVFVLGMALALLAGDQFTLIFGFELMSAASWLLVLQGDRKPATLYAGIAIFSGACLIPALFLPASSLAFVLIALGAGAKAGLAPLHSWLPRAHPAPPAGVSALMSGGMVKVALYVLIRYAFINLASAQQPWWGEALVAAGALSVLIGALRAVLEVELKTALACSTVEHVGLIAVGLGLALYAKASGDAALAGVALQAALLCAVAHGLFKPLLFIGAGEVKHATGTTSLNWLGGLMRGMPRLGALMLLGLVGMGALPLGPGFAPEFLLFHAVIGAAATGGILARIGFSALLAVLGIGAALALAAAVRIIGLGFLGRPRSLHAAAAEDLRRGPLVAMVLLGALNVPVALVPGLLLQLMSPVILLLAPQAHTLPLTYAPLTLLILAGFAALAAGFVQTRWGVRGLQEAPAWNGGFGRPPAWLPFGDPHTQVSATGFAEPVMRVMGKGLLGVSKTDPAERFLFVPLFRVQTRLVRLAERVRRATIRERLAFVFTVLVVFLLVLGLGEGG
ncbi:proton-conducting transporter transmembrane domain-containing protein [Acidocella aminolytica]|uniref:Hydrogenase 4 subunit B n=1 Tax=Acidocella aminolytica 101 = DSM 11237 TaxID=1120923 RepID=A0A0D6PHY4_9PROT|nr:proton-conducting transporter membrane subunit [Acidocella aminolytica]GAN81262.1 hydrogenase 4 subunit B [Acidocella aminolytica 101 = DSM 11237]GBQ41122.1 formate hydrogenlyase subunit 3 [Acidocella aminolytica 101 = DSM 11237]